MLRANLAELVGDLTTLEGIEEVRSRPTGFSREYVRAQGQGLKARDRSLDSLDDEVFARMSGGFRGKDRCSRASRVRPKPGWFRSRSRGDRARRQRPHVLDLVETLSRQRRDRPLHRVHGRGNRNHWEARDVVPSRELVARIEARGRCVGRGELPRRGGGALRFVDGAAAARSLISSVSEPFCGRAGAPTILGRRVYTCLFATEARTARALRACRRRCVARVDPERLAVADRPLQRRALNVRASERRARRSRCTTSEDETSMTDLERFLPNMLAFELAVLSDDGRFAAHFGDDAVHAWKAADRSVRGREARGRSSRACATACATSTDASTRVYRGARRSVHASEGSGFATR